MAIRYGKIARRTIRGKKSKYFSVRVYDSTTRTTTWRSTGCANMKSAQEWVRTAEHDRALGSRKFTQTMFEGAVNEWIEAKRGQVGDAHMITLETKVDRFWKVFFRNRILHEITADDLRKYMRDRSAGVISRKQKVSDSTVNGCLRDLKTFFRYCVGARLLDRNPADRVKKYSGEMRRRTRRLSLDEEARLLDACRLPYKSNEQTFYPPPYLHPLVLVTLRTGFRRRTLFALQWNHVDFRNRMWRIPGEHMKSRTDFEQPLAPSLVDPLKAWRQECRSDVFIFGKRGIRSAFGNAVARAGLDGFTFHDLRRVVLNRLRENGTSIEVAMAITDHRSVSTVMKHYAEVSIDERAAAIRGLG